MFVIVQALERGGWSVVTLRLIGAYGGTYPTFVLRRGDREVRIAYQTVPTSFLRVSRYKQILNAYDIDGSARRPDILLSAPGPRGALHLIIEVKLTDDRDYIVESIYKVLGYLADFDQMFAGRPHPHGVLVVWGGVRSVDSGDQQPVTIFDASGVREGKMTPVIEALAGAALELA
jgi:hypothetical protein